MDPREEVQDLQDRLDRLNGQKSSLQTTWEGEKKRWNDPDLPKPLELKALGTRLFHLYTERDSLLKRYPELQKEFGTPGRKKNRNKSFQVCRSTITAADRRRRKLLIHTGFKAWCAEQRPQVKASLENWEDPGIQLRFFRDAVATDGFETWCKEVGKSFCYATWCGQNNQCAFNQWDDFKAFCVAQNFPITVANFRNDDIQEHFQAWLVKEVHLRADEKKRQEEEAATERARSEAEAKARRLEEIEAEVDAIPPSFFSFLIEEGGVHPSDSAEILSHWKDEDSRALYELWWPEQ